MVSRRLLPLTAFPQYDITLLYTSAEGAPQVTGGTPMQASSESAAPSRTFIVTTTENIPGTRVVNTLGQVFGLTVRSRSLGGNIAAGLKSLVGGEIVSYVKLNEDARRQALDRMVQNATAMGANAVTMMRFDSTEMGRTMTEIVAYGTARIIETVTDAPDSVSAQG
jgi:uncharacterized protein YbjQ (UPF0145 family)